MRHSPMISRRLSTPGSYFPFCPFVGTSVRFSTSSTWRSHFLVFSSPKPDFGTWSISIEAFRRWPFARSSPLLFLFNFNSQPSSHSLCFLPFPSSPVAPSFSLLDFSLWYALVCDLFDLNADGPIGRQDCSVSEANAVITHAHLWQSWRIFFMLRFYAIPLYFYPSFFTLFCHFVCLAVRSCNLCHHVPWRDGPGGWKLPGFQLRNLPQLRGSSVSLISDVFGFCVFLSLRRIPVSTLNDSKSCFWPNGLHFPWHCNLCWTVSSWTYAFLLLLFSSLSSSSFSFLPPPFSLTSDIL